MIDIHMHILPELDDGAQSMEDSLNMAVTAVENGIDAAIATSHGNHYYSYTLGQYWERFYKLQEKLKEYRIPLDLYPGMEIMANHQACRLLNEEKLLSLNGSQNILIEFDFEIGAAEAFSLVDEFQKNGWSVILAHPERYRFIQENVEEARRLVLQDCALQINFGSLNGVFGEKERNTAWRLLRRNLVQFIASDAHSSKWRPPSFQGVRSLLSPIMPKEHIELLTEKNPARLLQNKEPLMLQLH